MDFEGSQSAFFAAPASSQLAAPSDLLPPQKTTHICRTNHHVLLRAVRVAARDRTSTLGCTISKANLRRIIGQLTDAYYLKKGRKHLMRGPMRQWYNTWADFEKDLEESADAELHTIREVVEDLQGEDAPALLRAVENRMVDDHMSADMIFTSLHKSKGLEFDHVELTNDFIDLTAAADSIIAERTPDKIPNSEALNLVYVAMTRAKHRLGVNPTLATWLEHNHTGSDRWVLRSHDGYCDSCLAASGTFVANESFHPDRAEQLCAGCVGAGGDTGRDPVVRWSLALAGASLSQLH
ncbi:hypothetical protein DFJ74DRAFT_693556 [Hyaloraphidium curvatum]|nr:hypothetical protein DFJ74DRAFT_693556 [Hyaloraphidium curvatum]